ncbi:hypothetical protein [Polaromonas sp. JS666]|uniref:hypothetical protein n=1 Tax=Polaromonas sp. (strain JS666 / ATCC BAA-500) TaxID=296591 RepID=UPI00005333E9|nr:hypothetical protein [Polaromonas sp. JS666]ABE43855.1 hypothetical protein Bpro_1924 [Polaromonas sp. JS666]
MNITTPAINNHMLISLISERQIALGKSDAELSTALGFERSTILTMTKSGAIKFPLNKIPALAEALELDASDLLVTAMKESAPDLLELIEQVWGHAL